MGVAVSSWTLARAVSQLGELGVVSGTGIDTVLTRRLQLGDPGGHMRRAMAAFPIAEVAERVLSRYFVAGGKAPDAPFKSKPLPSAAMPAAWTELTVVANFVEVFLAKEGHKGLVGINLLEKIQIPTLPSLFGAMLAGVDYVLMGAGIPRNIPAVLDRFSQGEVAELPLEVVGAEAGEKFHTHFDPASFLRGIKIPLKRPDFLAIVSSAALALSLARKSSGKVNGFVVEGSTAGGHNAPPRGAMKLDERGQPIYGERDLPDLAAFRELEMPFWLAGSFASPDRFQQAIADGAQGIQVGTAFAFCRESGLDPEIRNRVLQIVKSGGARVFTDPKASPTGFPFKVLDMENSMSEAEVYESRPRICDLGYLRTAYRQEDGSVGYRCAAEPLDDFVRKGGNIEDTVGRKCICNGLMSAVGIGQVRKSGEREPILITCGDDVAKIVGLLPPDSDGYSAEDVVRFLRG
jgi:nitronate monooxygenase